MSSLSSAFASHLPTNETERSTQWEAAPPDGRGASSDSPHVPDKLEQDSDNTEHEHSNDQRCHCWGELLAFIERLGESTETFVVKFTQVRNPIADAGGPLGYPFTVDKGIDTCNPLESICTCVCAIPDAFLQTVRGRPDHRASKVVS